MIKLPFNLFNKSIADSSDYLGLLLKEKEGIVFIIRLNNTNANIIAKERFTYSNNWDNLVEDIDEVLYRLELKGFKSPEKSIFFVYSNLVDKYKREIKKIYLLKIKEIVKNLEFKPLGYIEIHDAVIDLLTSKEGIPLSAILIEINNTALTIFLYKNGKRLFAEEVEKSENIIDSLLPVFEKMKVDTLLPSRILVYDSKNIEREVSIILSHVWSKDIFIHHPKIDIVNEEELTNSLIDVFTRQLSVKSIKEEPEPVKKTILGFVIGGDISKNVQKIEKHYFDKPIQILENLFSRIKNFKYSKNIFILIGVFLILMSVYLIELFFHKTEIILTLPSQSIEKSLTLDNIKPDISTKSTSFTVSKKTTGKKEIGEKAKGEVTIHNFASSEIQFDNGTKITTSNLAFILDSDTKVASGSLTSDKQNKFPGKTKAKVTAEIIGDKHNIAANNTFKIEDLPEADYFAINENPISGGTKKEVKNVSDSDISFLEKEVQKQAEAFKKDKIDPDFRKNHTLVNQLGGIDLANLNYDKELGEEASTLTLKAKANITYVGLNNDDVIKKILSQLNKEIEKNYVVEKDNITYKTTAAEQSKDEFIFEIDVEARASEKINLSEIKSSVSGKNISKIEDIVKKKYNAKELEVNVEHPIGFFKLWTSFIKKNIDLKVIYE